MKLSSSLFRGEGWRYWQSYFKEFFGRLLHGMFFTHRWIIDVVAGLLVVGLASYLVLTLLYLEPPDVVVADLPIQELNSTLVERLITWIEERARAREVGFVSPTGTLWP